MYALSRTIFGCPVKMVSFTPSKDRFSLFVPNELCAENVSRPMDVMSRANVMHVRLYVCGKQKSIMPTTFSLSVQPSKGNGQEKCNGSI